MDDYFEDFDDFGYENYGEEPMSDGLDDESEYWDELSENGPFDQIDDKPDEMPGSADFEPDEFTWKDSVILGGAMGWAYEEGFQDAVRWRQKRKNRKRLP